MKKQILLSISLLTAGTMLAMNDNNEEAPLTPRTKHLCEAFFSSERDEEERVELEKLLPKLPTQAEQLNKKLTALMEKSISDEIDVDQLTTETNFESLKASIKNYELLLIETLKENNELKESLFNRVISQQTKILQNKILSLNSTLGKSKDDLANAFKKQHADNSNNTSISYEHAQKAFVTNVQQLTRFKKQLAHLDSLGK